MNFSTRLKATTLLLFLSVQLTEAQVIERKQGRLILKDNDCERLKRAQTSLKFWTESLNKKRSCPPLEKIRNDGTSCQADITDCVPEHVKTYQGISTEMQGPNCWNLSLVMKEILPGLRYSTAEEMAFYMRPPLCRELKNNQKRLPGDVGAIRGIFDGQVDEEIHGFLYISEDLAYSKNGFKNDAPFEIQPLTKMFDLYEVSKGDECRQNSINFNSKCKNVVSYFRCDSMESYLKRQNKIPHEIRKALKSLNQYEQCMQKNLLVGGVLEDSSIATLVDTTNALIKFMETEKSQTNESNEGQDFLLGSIYLRINAIAQQLSLDESPEFENAMELTFMFRDNYLKFAKEPAKEIR